MTDVLGILYTHALSHGVESKVVATAMTFDRSSSEWQKIIYFNCKFSGKYECSVCII